LRLLLTTVAQRRLIAVLELAGLELPGPLLDEVPGQIEHVVGDLDLLNVVPGVKKDSDGPKHVRRFGDARSGDTARTRQSGSFAVLPRAPAAAGFFEINDLL
jgi:hypothetical protein